MSSETKTSQLIINKLTKEQFEAIVSPSDTELYLTPDTSLQSGDNISVLTNDAGYQTSSQVTSAITTAISGKQDTISDLADIRSNATAGKTASDTISGYGDIVTHNVSEFASSNLVPSQASSTNQLADKDFVNSSVSTNTANFKGTYDTLEELQAVENPTNNDYGIVKTTDTAGNTVYNRYKYVASSSTWVFEYALNNSSFTAAQWNAVNSTITADKVSSYDTHIADTTIHITADERTAWNAKSDFSGSYNDLTDKPTIPTVNNNTITLKQGDNVKGSFTLNQNEDTIITLDEGGSATTPTRIAEIHGTTTEETTELSLGVKVTKEQMISLNLGNTIILPELYTIDEENLKVVLSEPVETGVMWSVTYAKELNLVTLPIATSTQAGAVIVGDNLSINSDGVLSSVGTVTSVNNISPVNGNVTLDIPSAVTEETISGWGFTKNEGTITSVKMNGSVISTSGEADLGTVITSHQDISGKQDKSNLVTSISSSSTDEQYPSAKCMYDMIGDIESTLQAIRGV